MNASENKEFWEALELLMISYQPELSFSEIDRLDNFLKRYGVVDEDGCPDFEKLEEMKNENRKS